MKLFIDTANLNEIQNANDMGVICGVTTNPSIIAKEGKVFQEVIAETEAIDKEYPQADVIIELGGEDADIHERHLGAEFGIDFGLDFGERLAFGKRLGHEFLDRNIFGHNLTCYL